MTIREIELDNFRIYKGKNRIELFPDGGIGIWLSSVVIMVSVKQLFSCH